MGEVVERLGLGWWKSEEKRWRLRLRLREKRKKRHSFEEESFLLFVLVLFVLFLSLLSYLLVPVLERLFLCRGKEGCGEKETGL